MIEQLLESRLRPVWRRRWWLALGWKLAACWAVSAAAAAVLLVGLRLAGWASVLTVPVLVLGALVATAAVVVRHFRQQPNLRRLVREIEGRDAQLDGRLATALEQHAAPGAPLNFLQQRLIVEAVEASFRDNWGAQVSGARLSAAAAALLAAIAVFALLLASLRLPVRPGHTGLFVRVADIEVTPGDVSVERGTSFVVLARFGEPVPANAELVVQPAASAPQTHSLVRSLKDPVFGGSLPEVTEDFVYHVEFGGRRSPEFTVKVFEHPRLERADADLQFPEYTRLPPKRIEDTRRITAVEGTRLDLSLQLNKPVTSARLIPRSDANTEIPLTTDPSRAQVSLTGFFLRSGGTYDLRLMDGDGRSNKAPAQFVFDVVPNRVPELKLLAPRGDQRPSALEEISFDGTVWDDFGVLAYGFAYTGASRERTLHSGRPAASGPGAANPDVDEPVWIQLGTNVPAQEKRGLQHTLRLEDLGVAPDSLVSWFLWADDLGPDGEVRRTRSDLFFGEVRPFDEIFREGQSNSGGEQQGQQQDGSPTSKLAELQKQIINATWKLERDRSGAKAGPHAKDVGVVTDSQSQALDQAKEQGDGATDPRAEMMWGGVMTAMERALHELVPATNRTVSLAAALTAEKAAYQALLKLREREFQVTRGRNQRGGGGGGEQMRDRQLEQLELAQNENRYETQREAQSPQNPARREQLQVLNRLQELARRQEDLNERLKELQAELQAANTEKEREEIRRQLKRLQEEQQQMLADADELGQRLDRPENQSQFAEQRKQLEQTREELQRAAAATGQGATSQALASGTRAQQQLQQMREQLQQKSSSQFAEELREMRQEARELSRQQQSIGEKLDALQEEKRRSLSDSAEREALKGQLASQQKRLTNLVEQATQVSQAAEVTEPIVSRQLYDTLRQFSQDDAGGLKQMQEDLIRRGLMTRSLYERLQESPEAGAGRTIDMTQQLLQEGFLPQADAAEQQTRQSLTRLQQGVERAAESVLGDDTQALQRAQQELEELTRQIERELAQQGGSAPGADSRSGSNPTGNQSPHAGQPPNSEQPNGGEQPSQGQTGQAQTGQAQTGQAQTGQAQTGQGQTGQGQTGQAQTGQAQTGQAQTGQAQTGQAQTGQAQTGQAQTGQGQTGQGQTGQGQTGGRQGQTANAGTSGTGGSPRGPASAANGREQPGNRADRANADGRGTGPGGFDLTNLENFTTATEGGGRGTGPLIGEDFGPWSDRLREVEEMIDDPGLRSQVATARERARLTRLEFKRELKKPDWAVVRLQVVQPLVEVQQQIREELRRRNPGDTLVPIDRDPVPARYAELVRRYYEQLGKD